MAGGQKMEERKVSFFLPNISPQEEVLGVAFPT